jgi:hypothetical protein
MRPSPLGMLATIWPVVLTWMIDDDDERGAVGGMRICRGNRSTQRKPAPVPLCPPQIPPDLGLNHGCHSGKLATDHLNYGTAYSACKAHTLYIYIYIYISLSHGLSTSVMMPTFVMHFGSHAR